VVDNVAVATYVGIAVTLFSSLVLLAFHLGRLSMRVQSLEDWRRIIDERDQPIYETMRRIEALLKSRAH
jgi:UPF0716 family protein affecting phage T7 exclusion